MPGWEDLLDLVMRTGSSSWPEARTPQEKKGFSPLEHVKEVDRDTLAKTAKAEDPSAAAAVMWTIINRSRRRGTTIPEAEVLRPKQYHSWNNGDPSKKWTNILDKRQYKKMQGVADGVLGGEIPSPIGKREFFHKIGSPTPKWAPDEAKWLKVGKHAFY